VAAVIARKLNQIDTVQIDACKEETHDLSNTVTDHPVERGFNVTDHSRPDPDKVTLRCFVSNTPLSVEQKTRAVQEGSVKFRTTALQITETQGRGKAAFDKLKQLRDEGVLEKIITTLKNSETSPTEGMMITNLSISRTKENYDGLEFSISLKQVRIVQTRQASDSAPARDTRKGEKKKNGQQNTKPADRGDSGLWRTGDAGADYLSQSSNQDVASFGQSGKEFLNTP
jgi:hypothetical protein